MRLRRKADSQESVAGTDQVDAADHPEGGPDGVPGPDGAAAAGPYDVDDLPDNDIERIDLGSLLIAPPEGRDLRVQVDEQSGEVRAVLLASEEGAVELRAFAAPRGGDLWSEIRPQIAADAARRGGTATEREGRFGTELVCEVQVSRPDGTTGTQTSRVVGVNGPRWLLRATFLGEPARDPEGTTDWEQALGQIAVRRGSVAMPVGEQLPLNLPEGARPTPLAQS